ncbi:predicted protein [Plenodomus lingam JN3]|uniref:Predicted protein n=1 Tax=Leptosphaeria maculans (strain JN3 / isolate v23.1.3 / race Av1-4-5-6-7-8) TaxID=985895 RepID=E4ZME8_LEPMJ|nr:predicted protein [Plenodomus lingam JN3]CBX92497.1 predicted protein [Plenodomus lingam JN3]
MRIAKAKPPHIHSSSSKTQNHSGSGLPHRSGDFLCMHPYRYWRAL